MSEEHELTKALLEQMVSEAERLLASPNVPEGEKADLLRVVARYGALKLELDEEEARKRPVA